MCNYVAIGCDSNQEWMLPWWFENYSLYNNLPIIFGDFGLSPQMRSWCKERGELVPLVYSSNHCSWFKKSLFLDLIDADKVIYLDNDCEVKGNIDELLIYCNSINEIALRHDVVTQFNEQLTKKGHTPLQTGVLVYKPGNELIKEWSEACQSPGDFRGDQEILDFLVMNRRLNHNTNTRINIFPRKFNNLRLEEENKDAVIMHWTGPTGKKVIWEKINKTNLRKVKV